MPLGRGFLNDSRMISMPSANITRWRRQSVKHDIVFASSHNIRVYVHSTREACGCCQNTDNRKCATGCGACCCKYGHEQTSVSSSHCEVRAGCKPTHNAVTRLHHGKSKYLVWFSSKPAHSTPATVLLVFVTTTITITINTGLRQYRILRKALATSENNTTIRTIQRLRPQLS